MVKYNSKAPEVLFRALSQDTRRSMVEHLARKGTLSVSELQRPLDISLPATLKQVRVLKEAGLVSCTKEGRVQYCTINKKTLDHMVDWLMAQQQFWEGSFDRLEQHITNLKK